MELIGKWKFKALEVPDFETEKVQIYTREQLKSSTDKKIESFAFYADVLMEFKNNGETTMWMKIPEDLDVNNLSDEEKMMLESAVDGYVDTQDSKAAWEENNGKYYMVGEYEDNGKPSRNEIIINNDGTITLQTFISRVTYEKY